MEYPYPRRRSEIGPNGSGCLQEGVGGGDFLGTHKPESVRDQEKITGANIKPPIPGAAFQAS
jgi:hypothetical protein